MLKFSLVFLFSFYRYKDKRGFWSILDFSLITSVIFLKFFYPNPNFFTPLSRNVESQKLCTNLGLDWPKHFVGVLYLRFYLWMMSSWDLRIITCFFRLAKASFFRCIEIDDFGVNILFTKLLVIYRKNKTYLIEF